MPSFCKRRSTRAILDWYTTLGSPTRTVPSRPSLRTARGGLGNLPMRNRREKMRAMVEYKSLTNRVKDGENMSTRSFSRAITSVAVMLP